MNEANNKERRGMQYPKPWLIVIRDGMVVLAALLVMGFGFIGVWETLNTGIDDDISKSHQDLSAEVNSLDGNIMTLGKELKAEINSLDGDIMTSRVELKAEINSLDTRVYRDFQLVRDEIRDIKTETKDMGII